MLSHKLTLEKSKEINSLDYLYTCKKCGQAKPNSEYSRSLDYRNKNSLARAFVSQCKICRRKYSASKEVLEKRRANGSIQRNKHRLSVIYWASKSNAKKRNLDHNITLEYIKTLFDKQKGLCYYTNKKMYTNTVNSNNNQDSVSLDRIDSSKGYIEGNIVLCRWIVNRMKNDINLKEFLKIVSDIHVKYNKHGNS